MVRAPCGYLSTVRRESRETMSSLDERLEAISDMAERARAICAALDTGATVETDTDADAAVREACDLARELLALGEAALKLPPMP
jgi:hypothetical protein